jgi:hypothetical protein
MKQLKRKMRKSKFGIKAHFKKNWEKYGLALGALGALGAAGVGIHKASKTTLGKQMGAVAGARATVALAPAKQQLRQTQQQLGQTAQELGKARDVVHAAGEQAVEASKLAAITGAGRAAAIAAPISAAEGVAVPAAATSADREVKLACRSLTKSVLCVSPTVSNRCISFFRTSLGSPAIVSLLCCSLGITSSQ